MQQPLRLQTAEQPRNLQQQKRDALRRKCPFSTVAAAFAAMQLVGCMQHRSRHALRTQQGSQLVAAAWNLQQADSPGDAFGSEACCCLNIKQLLQAVLSNAAAWVQHIARCSCQLTAALAHTLQSAIAALQAVRLSMQSFAWRGEMNNSVVASCGAVQLM
jgi:hypothetical protein